MIKQKVYLLPEKLDQLSNLNIDLVFLLILLIDVYCSFVIYWLIVLLKSDSKCLSSFILSWVDKIQLKPKICISYCECVACAPAIDNTHLYDQMRIKLISEFINGISRVH